MVFKFVQPSVRALKFVYRFLDRNLFPTVMIGATLLIYYWYVFQIGTVEITIDVGEKTGVQVYWSDENSNFSETNSAGKSARPGVSTIRIRTEEVGEGNRFRIDPGREENRVEILGVTVKSRFSPPRALPLSGEFGPEAHGTALIVHPGGRSVVLESTGEDPQLWWDGVVFREEVAPGGSLEDRARWWGDLLVLLLISGFWILLGRMVPALEKLFLRRFYFVPVVLLLIAGGVFAIAIGSEHGNHPDEPIHAAAGYYYMTDWMLPQADDPAIRGSYSAYGYSRLNGPKIGYFLAGRFSNLVGGIDGLAPVEKLRLYNATLFLALALFSFLHIRFRILLIPFLLSPQFWYLFAYFNMDATGIAACYFAAFATVHPSGWMERLRRSKNAPAVALWIGTACLFGALISLQRMNFWPFGGFLVGYLFVRAFAVRSQRRTCLRWVTAAVLALGSGVLAQYLWMEAFSLRNGKPVGEVVMEMHLETAREEFLVTTDREEQFAYMGLRARGVSFRDLFRIYRWHDFMIVNSFGNYRWLNVHPDLLFVFRMFRGCVIALVLLLIPPIFGVSWDRRVIAFGALFTALTLLAAAFSFAWNRDFQAQGRYLAAILPVLGVALLSLSKRTPWAVAGVPVAVSIFLGLYSFFVFAIPEE